MCIMDLFARRPYLIERLEIIQRFKGPKVVLAKFTDNTTATGILSQEMFV